MALGFCRALLVYGALLGSWTPHAQAARRMLHVSLYPFIPQPEAAALALKQGFERTHPDVIVDITFNSHYYSTLPADRGVLYEKADIYEIDTILLRDFVARHQLAELPASYLATLDVPETLALQAVSPGGRVMAVAHWMCMDYLIYRADGADLANVHTLAQLQAELGPSHGLLLGMSRDSLGELYYTAWLAGHPAASMGAPSVPIDPVLVDRLRRMLALEPAGLGRVAAYEQREGFYARQFARRVGVAFVGYSEMMHEALDETAAACRIEDRCVTADELRVTTFPFADDSARAAVWVDAFGIDARVHGQKLADAEAFVRYAVSLPAYRDLLIPAAGEAPRYLLPATQAAFADPAILHAAPLYPRLQALVRQGVVFTGVGLEPALAVVAGLVDAALPATH